MSGGIVKARPRSNGASTGPLAPAEVCKALGVSRQRVGALVKEGILHPTRDARGVRLFDRAEVLAYAQSRKSAPRARGKVAARVFELFARRWGLRAIVMDTLQTPEEIRRLWREWMRPLNADADEAEEARAEAFSRGVEAWADRQRQLARDEEPRSERGAQG
jgi:excisionase family DNA binding protein